MHFLRASPRNISSGRRSDNFDASGLPDSSSESFCPKVFREHVENVGTFKIGGPSPLQSHLIQIRVRPKQLFMEHFWVENCFSRPNRPLLTIECYTSLESYGSQLSHGIFETIFCSSCKASEFRGRIRTEA